VSEEYLKNKKRFKVGVLLRILRIRIFDNASAGCILKKTMILLHLLMGFD